MADVNVCSSIPSVSIALATYNGERFLAEQLESLAHQSLLPLELVVCDDCSSDQSMAIVQDFAAWAPFPVIILKNATRRHYSETFLNATEQCTGFYIAFCDQDDIWLPEKLEQLLHLATETSATLCTHSYKIIDEAGSVINESFYSGLKKILRREELDSWGTYQGFTCFFKREILSIFHRDQRPIDLLLPHYQSAHDRWVYFLAMTLGTIAHIDKPLALYRQHSNNVFGQPRPKIARRIKNVITRYDHYLRVRARIAERHFLLLGETLKKDNYRASETEVNKWRLFADEYRCRLHAIEHRSILSRLINVLKCGFKGRYQSVPGKRAVRSVIEDLIASAVKR